MLQVCFFINLRYLLNKKNTIYHSTAFKLIKILFQYLHKHQNPWGRKIKHTSDETNSIASDL